MAPVAVLTDCFVLFTSWTCLGATVGGVEFFDRAEKIAFNAMPAAWASPRGGDMWAHPYL